MGLDVTLSSVICSVCDVAGENKSIAGKAGAIQELVAAMRAHVRYAGVSEQACGALRNLIWSDGAFGVGLSVF